MTDALSTEQRIERAQKLGEVLDAAYVAFDEMLTVIRRYEDSGAPFHAALVIAAAAAADGRDAVAAAPSLPSPGLHDEADMSVASAHPSKAAAYVASLSQAVAAALRQAAGIPSALADREACADAARYAGEVHSLASGDRA